MMMLVGISMRIILKSVMGIIWVEDNLDVWPVDKTVIRGLIRIHFR